MICLHKVTGSITSASHAKKLYFSIRFFFRTYTPPLFNRIISKNVLFTCCRSDEYDWKLHSPIHYFKKILRQKYIFKNKYQGIERPGMAFLCHY